MFLKKIKFNYGLFFIVIAFFLVCSRYLNFIPIWDGRTYYDDCLKKVVNNPFLLSNFNCFGHPSFFYTFIVFISHLVFPENPLSLHIPNMLLGILAIYCFNKLIIILTKEKTALIESYIITAIFAFYPVFLANLFNLNLDYPVVVFFLVFLYFLLDQKLFLSALAALFLIFSKETGFILFTTTIGIYLITFRKKINQLFVFLIPCVSYAIYIFLSSQFFYKNPFWNNSYVYWLINLIPMDFFSKYFYFNLISVFVINFNWIFTFLIVYCLFFGSKRIKSISQNKNIKFIFLLLIISTFFLTRYKTFNNLRYFLPLYPLLIIFFYLIFFKIFKKGLKRIVFLLVIFFIFFLSNFFTFDPISMRIFRTFNFGDHKLLKMTSLTEECCGYGRDQLVYNLEYTKFHYLQNIIYSDLKPSAKTYVIHPDKADFFLNGALDKNTNKRSLSTNKDLVFSFRSIDVSSFLALKKRPNLAFFIDYPNFSDYDKKMLNLSFFYQIALFKEYNMQGYRLSIYKLTLR